MKLESQIIVLTIILSIILRQNKLFKIIYSVEFFYIYFEIRELHYLDLVRDYGI